MWSPKVESCSDALQQAAGTLLGGMHGKAQARVGHRCIVLPLQGHNAAEEERRHGSTWRSNYFMPAQADRCAATCLVPQLAKYLSLPATAVSLTYAAHHACTPLHVLLLRHETACQDRGVICAKGFTHASKYSHADRPCMAHLCEALEQHALPCAQVCEPVPQVAGRACRCRQFQPLSCLRHPHQECACKTFLTAVAGTCQRAQAFSCFRCQKIKPKNEK